MKNGKSIALVTGADKSHFPLLMDMLDSVQEVSSRKFNFCCLDLGFEAEQRNILINRGVNLVEPGWDCSGEFPGPWFRAMTARPFLPKYFPHNDIYLWIDSDCWLQNDMALEAYISLAETHDLVASAAVHHDYRQIAAMGPEDAGPPTQIFYSYLYNSLFPPAVARALMEKSYCNAGVFAMPANSVIWRIWQDILEPTYQRARQAQVSSWQSNKVETHGLWQDVKNKALFHTEEACLNAASLEAKVAVLDATCNWICNQRIPDLNIDGKLITPGAAHQEISIIHLTAKTKEIEFKIRQPDLSKRPMSLRRSEFLRAVRGF